MIIISEQKEWAYKVFGSGHAAAGHIILRGWCERTNNNTEKLYIDKKDPRPAPKSKQHVSHAKEDGTKDNKITLWFEVDDTGCG